MMTFRAMPAFAAWQHQGAHPGFEVSYFRNHDDGIQMRGCTTAVEEGVPWIVEYDISLDVHWLNTRAIVRSLDADGDRTIVLEQPEPGRWLVDGEQATLLDGIFDVDLEASSLTNMLPIHRMQFTGDGPMDAPAAYVRADLTVERLEQTYRMLDSADGHYRFDYTSPSADFRAELVYDASGLVVDYPGIAVRSS